MDTESLSEQIEEIEALSAIYGQDFLVVDEAKRIYEIRVSHESDSWWSATLQVLLPPEYPSKVPPVFEIHSAWMCEADLFQVADLFYTISRDHHGEILLYQWVEALRAFIDKSQQSRTEEGKKEEVGGTVSIKVSDSGNEEPEICDFELESLTVSDQEDNALGALQSAKLEDKPEIIHGEPFTDRKSTFQAHLAHVVTQEQVKQVMEELRRNRKISNAAHNVMAYRIFCKDRNSFLQDCDDDGEAMAGGRLLHLLQILEARNIVVIVTRWYGGILLGPDRFKHYNNCARDVIKVAGFMDHNLTDRKESKSKSRSKIGKKHKQ